MSEAPAVNTFARPRTRITVEAGSPPAWAIELMSRILLDAGWSPARVARARLVWRFGRGGTGHAWPWRDRIAVTASRSWPDHAPRINTGRGTLIHECAHLLTPGAHHSKVFKRVNARLQARYYPQFVIPGAEPAPAPAPVAAPVAVAAPVDEWGLAAAFDDLAEALAAFLAA